MHALPSPSLTSAQTLKPSPLTVALTELDPINRWTVYRRLQELGLTCRYGRASDSGTRCELASKRDPKRHLTVAVHTASEALLVWSVVHTVTQSKPALTDHLERCWQQRSPL